MPPWCRASALERELVCPSAGNLPQDDSRPDSVRDAADWGTMVHRWKATGEVMAQPGRDGHVALFKDRLFRTKIRVEDWWPAEGRHEVAMAVDCVRKSRASEMQGTKVQTEAWRNGLDDAYVAGEADYIGEVLGDPWVDDLKTGRLPSAPTSVQHKCYALGAFILMDSSPGRVVTSTTHWPRYPRDGRPHREWGYFSARELTAFHRELTLARRKKLRVGRLPLIDQQANAVPGEHCLYCNGAKLCTKRNGN